MIVSSAVGIIPSASAGCGFQVQAPLAMGARTEVAPFGPRSIVVLDVRIAQQVGQDEPGQAGALADAAVGDDGSSGLRPTSSS